MSFVLSFRVRVPCSSFERKSPRSRINIYYTARAAARDNVYHPTFDRKAKRYCAFNYRNPVSIF